MAGVVRRRFAAAVTTGALLATAAVAVEVPDALADPAPIGVTMSPASGPVGTALALTAASGLATVESVTFPGAVAVAPTSPPTDTELDVVVPTGATTGPLTLTYADSSTAQTDQAFTVQVPTAATIASSRRAIDFRQDAVIAATVTAAGVAVSGQAAHLQRTAPHSSAWRDIRHTRTTSSAGRVAWTVSPHSTSAYRVVVDDSTAYQGSTTPRVRVAVVPLVAFHGPDVAPILTATTLAGRVRPAPTGDRTVRLQQRVDGAWHRVGHTGTDRDGRFAFSVTMPDTGRHAYRVRRPHDAGHRAALSAAVRLRAVQRTLRSGMSGPDVKALQRRLAALRYDVGGVTGSYGFDTQHAVVAFEKVQGLDRDGVVGLQVWKALEDPRRPHLAHAADADTAGVEVDLTRQVVYYAVHGRIRRILDASTGGGYTYTGSDGTQQQAVTPTGHFSIVYKRDGWVHAPLGELYRPAYFNTSGYAIHGETAVPPYPASHGCVRITVPAMDRMNAKLYVGLSVWIYRS